MVVKTVDQTLNCGISGVAFDMAEKMGGEVCLLNDVPSPMEGAGVALAGLMTTTVHLVVIDDA
jgi:hypothetical protein